MEHIHIESIWGHGWCLDDDLAAFSRSRIWICWKITNWRKDRGSFAHGNFWWPREPQLVPTNLLATFELAKTSLLADSLAHILLIPSATNGMLEPATSLSSHVLPEAGSGRGLITPRHSKTNFPLLHYWRLRLIGSDRERMCHYTVDSCTCQRTEKDRGSQTSLATKIGLAGGLWLSSCLLGAKHKVPFSVLMAMIFLPIFMTTISVLNHP